MKETIGKIKKLEIALSIEDGGNGLYYGTSPQLKGLLVVGDSPEQVRRRAPRAIKEIQSLLTKPDYVGNLNRIIEAAEDGQDMQGVINELKGLRALIEGDQARRKVQPREE